MTKYYAVVTLTGTAVLAEAVASGNPVQIATMAVGDGGGELPTPVAEQTSLLREVWRGALNKISVDARNKNYIVAEVVIPPETGGFWMREMGLFDASGALIAVGNMAESYKPLLSEGSGRTQTLRMVILVSDIASVSLDIDSTTVLASESWVTEQLSAHEQSRNHPNATLDKPGFTQLCNDTDSDSEVMAATPKAVNTAWTLANTANTNASNRLDKSRNLTDLTNKETARSALGLKAMALQSSSSVAITGGVLSGMSRVESRYLTGTFGILVNESTNTGIAPGTDSASMANANLLVKSWWGIGFYCSQNYSMAGVIDTRTGTLQMRSTITPGSYSNFDARYYTQAAANTKFVTGVRLGASSVFQERANNERLTGGVMTSWQDKGSSNYWLRLRPVQYLINGTWHTAAYA